MTLGNVMSCTEEKHPLFVKKYNGLNSELAFSIVNLNPVSASMYFNNLGDNIILQSENDYRKNKKKLSLQLVLTSEQLYGIAFKLDEFARFLSETNVKTRFTERVEKYSGTIDALAKDTDSLNYKSYRDILGFIATAYGELAQEFYGENQGVCTRLELLSKQASAAYRRMSDVWITCEPHMQK
jgi:hypothetical protein